MTLAQTLAIIAALGSAICWLVAVASAIAMTKHRVPGVTLLYLATHGIVFFDERFFTNRAAPHRQRLIRAFGAFFGFVFLGFVIGTAATR